MRYVDPDGRFVFAVPIVIGVEELGKIIVSALCVYIAIKVQTYDGAKTEDSSNENKTVVIYRLGNGNGTNLTPRPEKDDTGLSYTLIKPEGVPYTETTMEAVNATGVLTAIQDSPTHISVVPVEISTMADWQASRENANENPHPYTQILQSISIRN